VKEHPILFSAEMVRALLADKKTVTRRLSKSWLKVKAGDLLWVRETHSEGCDEYGCEVMIYAADGSYKIVGATGEGYGRVLELLEGKCGEHATRRDDKWTPSIFMPRWASRITLRATADARLERLRDITKADALAEGITVLALQSEDDPSAWYQSAPGIHQERSAQLSYAALWDSLSGKTHPWTSNPEVVRIAFKWECANGAS